MNPILPGLNNGFVDSLREAAEYNEIERAQNLILTLPPLLDHKDADARRAILTVLAHQVLGPLNGEVRIRANMFLTTIRFLEL